METNTTYSSRIRKRKVIGYILLTVVIVFTAFAYAFVNELFKTFNKPFTFSYINYSLKTVFLLIYWCKEKFKQKFLKKNEFEDEAIQAKTTHEYNISKINEENFSETFDKIGIEKKYDYENNLCKIVSILMFLYFLPTFLLGYGMSKTCDCTKFLLSNLCTAFILVEKIVFFRGKCSIFRFVILMILYTGVLLFRKVDNIDGPGDDNTIGDVCIFVAVFLFSIYLNVMKYYSKLYRHQFDFTLILGYIGLYVLIFIPFAIIILVMMDVEIFSLPNAGELKTILFCSLFSSLNDILICYSVILLSPHLVSLGYNLYFPLIITYYIIVGKNQFDLYYLFGAILMLTAFFLFIYEHWREYDHRKKAGRLVSNNTENKSENLI